MWSKKAWAPLLSTKDLQSFPHSPALYRNLFQVVVWLELCIKYRRCWATGRNLRLYGDTRVPALQLGV